MEKHLDQSEIDSMFASSRDNTAKEEVAALSEEATPERKHAAYNFNRAGQINQEQMQAISTVNDLFARNLTHNMGAWLRTEFGTTLVSAEQLVYSEFTERIPELAYVCSVRLDPLDALGVLQMDLAMAPPMVDLLLGGVGRSAPLRKSTDIEEDILLSVMEIVVRELKIAWQPVGLKFALERREPEAEVSRLMPLSEKTLCMSFEIRMPEAQGTLNLCLPAVVLNTTLRRLIAERDRPRRRTPEARARMASLMEEAQFGAMLQFPTMHLNARVLADMAPGAVLRLPLPRQAMAELRVGGLAIFHAQPVRSGEHRGAQVKGHTDDAQRQGMD
jgi:flagellar motor switch protein FliM